jgi:lipopolysaccharide export system protein LptA
MTLCLLLVLVQEPSAQGNNVILEHADSLVGTVIMGEQARELIGNVRMIQDDVRVTCDSATQFLRTGEIFLSGNVVVKDDSVTMRAPRGSYDPNLRRAEGRGGVALDDGKVLLLAREGVYYVDEKRAFFRTDVLVREQTATILSDSLTYYRPETRSVAEGNVRVHDSVQDLVIAGTRLEHWSGEGFSRMTGDPALVQVDTTIEGQLDTLLVRSRVMESYRTGQRRLLAIDSVRIVRSDLSAIAGIATFHPDGDSIALRTEPVVWYEQNQVSGDSINVYLQMQQLSRVDVQGKAFGSSLIDTAGLIRFDQLSGETMDMQFADRKLNRVTLDRRATSVYHLFEDSLANGLNRTSGDRIIMEFDSGKVGSITVIGGVEGEYVPENLLQGNESSYHLPGFLWRDDRPFISAADRVEIGRITAGWESDFSAGGGDQ